MSLFATMVTDTFTLLKSVLAVPWGMLASLTRIKYSHRYRVSALWYSVCIGGSGYTVLYRATTRVVSDTLFQGESGFVGIMSVNVRVRNVPPVPRCPRLCNIFRFKVPMCATRKIKITYIRIGHNFFQGATRYLCDC